MPINNSQRTFPKEAPMLSRANSDAALRLRRAKSSTSSSHRPFEPSISTEPRYAEVAAVEAYTRAYRYSQGDRPQRRRSRRSEGSHFDDNRRKSTQKSDRLDRPTPVPGPATTPANLPARPPTRQSLLPDTPYRFALEASNDPTVTMTDVSESRLSTASRRQTRDLQTDDEIKTAAWDAYLQGFHKKEVRERKSFAIPLRKRFSKSPALTPSIQYDTSVPPYNFVEDFEAILSTAPPVEIGSQDRPETPGKLKKQRTVPDSLKGRFKRLLSRPKRVQSQFPAQHVEARNLHFDVYKTNDDSFSAGPDYGVSLPRSPFSSIGASSGAQSRITSWSNSTVSRHGKRLPSIEETSTSQALGSTADEPSTGSFLGRALRFPLRRPSQPDLQAKSEDSKRLYDALQKRINNPEVPAIIVEDVTPQPCAVVFNDSPPMSPASETIRMVTPEPTIPESPTRPAPDPPQQVTRKSSWWSMAPSICAKKRRQAEPVVPSNEQIAARAERSENRWQAALEDGSPVVSRALNYCIKGDNPYELRPLKDVNSSLPVAVRHKSDNAAAPTFGNGADLHDIRQHVISPSIYSRSVTPNAVGTFITITGHEVKRYPLDSPLRPVNGPSTFAPKPSNEWRAWFSKEIEDFSMMPAHFGDAVLARPDSSPSDSYPNKPKESPQQHPPMLQPTKSRPELRSRASSIMNERYPLIDTGRPSSRASGRRTNLSSTSSGHRSASGSGASVAERTSSKTSQRGDADQSTLSSSNLRERQSPSALTRKKSSLAIRAARHGYGPSTDEIDSAGREDTVKAPKSALDLRVMYRNNRNLEASSLNIRRRVAAPNTFDDTLRRISEGPYATDSKENIAPPRPSIDGITIPPFYTPTEDSSKSKGCSPGQRMVDEFLNSRKAHVVPNSPPAFI
ncbi:hypothetical protein QM012_009556 [Aureobasidium pullulans]|uniref:Uncharacterized protein n=1 Tax=Aureobasidium pullulans TaxID=5580 RepID=A0ABR0TIP6_AURPU